jgi:hypothetical protein
MKLFLPGIRSSQQGSVIITAMAIVIVVGVAVGAALTLSSNVARNSYRSRQRASAESVADGSLEVMYAKWCAAGHAALQSNQGLPTAADLAAMSGVGNTPGPGSTPAYPDFAGVSFVSYTLDALDAAGVPTGTGTPAATLIPVAGRPGWMSRSYNYLAKAGVTVPVVGGTESMTVGRRFQKADAPIFQSAIFYEGVLEIHPGADMNITGLVHTNTDLYASTSGPNLTFSRNVSYGGSYAEGMAPGDGRAAMTVAPTYPSGKSSQLNQVDRMEPLGIAPSAVFNTTDANPNNDSFRELIERPVSGQTDPAEIAPLRFYNQAGLKILLDTSLATTDANRVRVYNGRGVELTTAGGASVAALLTTVKAAVSSGETIRDNREANNVLLTSFDMSQLSNIVTQFSALSAPSTANLTSQAVNTYNKVIYIADVSANANGGTSAVNGTTAQAEKAVRLRNGAILPDDVTVASENPVYIQGDYNTGGPTGSVVSNAATPSSPMSAFNNPDAPGYVQKSCAVLGDAVNILSNNWNDANSASAVSSRTAKNTTINTGILSGNVPTNVNSDGQYSGGAENFPRFLEDWGGKCLTYYGSMVCLFNSKQGNGEWGAANVYGAPTRRWFFDQNFLLKPPPGMLQSTTYSRGRWVRY